MAHHLAEAGLPERAIEYLKKAGEHAILRSANVEAISHLKRALELFQSLFDHQARTHKALELVVLLSQAMIAGRGYAAAETKEVLLKAKSLIDQSTDPAQKFSILYGIWACHYVGGEVAPAGDAASDFVREAERLGDTAALCLSHRALGTTYVTMGEFVAGRQHLERARALYTQMSMRGSAINMGRTSVRLRCATCPGRCGTWDISIRRRRSPRRQCDTPTKSSHPHTHGLYDLPRPRHDRRIPPSAGRDAILCRTGSFRSATSMAFRSGLRVDAS